MKYKNIREEELKNKVGQDFFAKFDTTRIIGNIDFCVTPLKSNKSKQSSLPLGEGWGGDVSLLWAEAKTGDYDLYAMFAQLILTIGNARKTNKDLLLPPAFLGAFDAKKIAFVSYNAVMDIFSINDFNWTVTPSNHETKEFALIKERIEKALDQHHYLYDYIQDEAELKEFIKTNLANATESGKILIDKNNFVPIYLRWLTQVKPCINFDWAEGRKHNILDSDFYLADLFVDDKGTAEMGDDTPLSDNLFVVFRNSQYEILNKNLPGFISSGTNAFGFKDKKVYEQFWKKYKRPPLEEFQHYIIDRRDLLVPQDIRERKGAFFTPQKWVELSQKYLADVLGEDWQEEYYIWDCAAGTGNLLAGLTNKYHIFASTLDQADVSVMHERIDNHAILLKEHCFQFDFLNDDFSKLPQNLQNIINDPEKRKKLVVYINPPYAEAGSGMGRTSKENVALEHKTNDKYKAIIGNAANEIFVQFLTRIYDKLDGSILAQFSTLKIVQGPNFDKFRKYFKSQFLSGFVTPANTFDNVKGSFPIGFYIWDLSKKLNFTDLNFDIYDKNGDFEGTKMFYTYDDCTGYINNWLRLYYDKKSEPIGIMHNNKNDFQHNLQVQITTNDNKDHTTPITKNNLIQMSIYNALRKCIEATWLNDRDQFLNPNDGWQTDIEFQNDCLAYTLFSNNIQSKFGQNHWIPFTEQEIDAKAKFDSNFMTDFISSPPAPLQRSGELGGLFAVSDAPTLSGFKTLTGLGIQFSNEATAVFTAGRELWKYYHAQPFPTMKGNYNPNASLYDIREYFQGRNPAGKMNNKSQDEIYMKFITALRESLKTLAKKIEPKVYEYGFLKA